MFSTLLLPLCIIPPVFSALGPIHVPLKPRVAPRSLEHYSYIADRIRSKYGYSSSTKAKRAGAATSIPLIDLEGDSAYLASINIGTPPQTLDFLLDTGSSDLWVATSECTTCSGGTPTFDTSKSSTFRTASNAPDQINYGSGAVSGEVAEDTVDMAGFTVSNQILVAVTETTKQVLTGSTSGIMGLGWQAIATTKALPFWQALMNNNGLQSPEMAFALATLVDQNNVPEEAPGGTFTLGGTNSSLYTGSIEFLNLAGSEPSFWLLPLSSLSLGGKTVPTATGNNALCAIDTGTTLIAGPTDDVQTFWGSVQGSESLGENMPGFYSYPCKTQLNVAMSFGGQSWPVSDNDMNIGQVSDGSDQCVGAIFDLSQGSSIGPGEGPSWVVGDTFLKNVYAVFRGSPPSVGFAQLSSGSGGGSSAGSPGGSTSKSAGSAAYSTSLTLITTTLLSVIACLTSSYL